MSFKITGHSKSGQVLEMVAYTALVVVCLVLWLVEQNTGLLVVAFAGVGTIVARLIWLWLRSKGRGGDTD